MPSFRKGAAPSAAAGATRSTCGPTGKSTWCSRAQRASSSGDLPHPTANAIICSRINPREDVCMRSLEPIRAKVRRSFLTLSRRTSRRLKSSSERSRVSWAILWSGPLTAASQCLCTRTRPAPTRAFAWQGNELVRTPPKPALQRRKSWKAQLFCN